MDLVTRCTALTVSVTQHGMTHMYAAVHSFEHCQSETTVKFLRHQLEGYSWGVTVRVYTPVAGGMGQLPDALASRAEALCVF
jgi:hypothetical protein